MKIARADTVKSIDMKNYLFDEEKLLSMFTGDVEFRPEFSNPWLSVNENLVCASESHILIQIKAECLRNKYPASGKLSAIKYVENCNHTVMLEDIKEALDKVPKIAEEVLVEKGKECPECDGCGVVTVEYESKSGRIYEIECDCPVCDGDGMEYYDRYDKTGKMIPDELANIAFNNFNFDARFVQLLYDALVFIGVDSVKVVSIGEKQPAVFRVDENINIFLMPRLIGKAPDTVIKLH